MKKINNMKRNDNININDENDIKESINNVVAKILTMSIVISNM